MLKKIIALLKKDFLIETSYKLAFLLNIFHVVSTLLVYFLIDKLFGHRITRHLEEFGVNYFSYILLSRALFSYIGVGMGSFAAKIRQEQLQGTLESLLLTPTRISTILSGMCLWNFIFATLDIIIYAVLAIFVFKIDFSNINIISAITIMLLTVITFSGLGIISASFILVVKRGNPLIWVMNNLEGILGGVYFPIAVMPNLLQLLAKFLPITYAIRGIELAVYKGYPLWKLKTELLLLLIFSAILIPAARLSFKFALQKARRQGSLGQY